MTVKGLTLNTHKTKIVTFFHIGPTMFHSNGTLLENVQELIILNYSI